MDNRITAIGSESATCPYCGADVDKVKGCRDCPSCGQYIHACRRPFDEKYVLLTSQQRLKVDEQWSIARGYHDKWLACRLRFEAESARLAEQLLREPTEREVKSSLLEKERDEVRENKQWGLYRNCIYAIAELAWHYRDMKDVIHLQSQVIYIDRCGPSNSHVSGNGFNAKTALPMACGPICRLIEAAISEGVTIELLKNQFLSVASTVQNDLKTRVKPTTAWREVQNYANKYYRKWEMSYNQKLWMLN